MKEPEVLFTYEEALPWIREYYDEYAKTKKQEAKCWKIMRQQRKRAEIREKVCGVATIIALVIIPVIILDIYGTTNVDTTIKMVFILIGMILAKTIL